MFNFLQPYPLTITTPPEFQPYGWTTTDLWCAPLITALYATLTHAQPYWADLHYSLFGWMSSAASANGVAKIAPVDAETARALCAIVLAGLFGTRTWRTYNGVQTAKMQLAKGAETAQREKKQQ